MFFLASFPWKDCGRRSLDEKAPDSLRKYWARRRSQIGMSSLRALDRRMTLHTPQDPTERLMNKGGKPSQASWRRAPGNTEIPKI